MDTTICADSRFNKVISDIILEIKSNQKIFDYDMYQDWYKRIIDEMDARINAVFIADEEVDILNKKLEEQGETITTLRSYCDIHTRTIQTLHQIIRELEKEHAEPKAHQLDTGAVVQWVDNDLLNFFRFGKLSETNGIGFEEAFNNYKSWQPNI